ncbi:sugar ABC transporter ATP-binding protein (plasmid) [Rickettsiales bacterium Ac37b]|nr:sugar ABC transporter ATP-binding protein [Rickettsiales bacterium Ac37b]
MIILENVSLDYPILDIGSHSLQVALTQKVKGLIGGKIGYSSNKACVKAIDEISLEIKDGQRIGIIGHNGSGKTSLLRLMSGIYSPTQGNIFIKGKIQSLTDFSLGMDPDVSGIKNIIFRLVFMGYTYTKAKQAIEEIVNFSELTEFIHLPMRTYSTGMFLRLAFAISTHLPPDILILDEVIGAGDESFKQKALARLDYLFTKSRIVILSSHDLGAVQKYCSHVILLNKGKIIAKGSPEEVIEAYLKQSSFAKTSIQ